MGPSDWRWRWALSGIPEDAWLLALGSAVSDGSKVDWDEAERSAADPETQRVVRDIRERGYEATMKPALRTLSVVR